MLVISHKRIIDFTIRFYDVNNFSVGLIGNCEYISSKLSITFNNDAI